MKYIEKDGKPVPCHGVLEWAEWFETADRTVKVDRIKIAAEEVRVSTVFLGIDHNFSGEGDPILYETMVFSGNKEWDQLAKRYRTRKEALAGHAQTISAIMSGEGDLYIDYIND